MSVRIIWVVCLAIFLTAMTAFGAWEVGQLLEEGSLKSHASDISMVVLRGDGTGGGGW